MTTEQVLRQLLNAITENVVYGDPNCDCDICKAVILAKEHCPKFVYIGCEFPAGMNCGRYTAIDEDQVFDCLDELEGYDSGRVYWGIELDEPIGGLRIED